MIDKFVKRWDAGQEALLEKYTKKAPSSYSQIFEDVVEILSGGENYDYDCPSPEYITELTVGQYQGSTLFVAGCGSGTFWAVVMSYGSCSGCDAFEAATEPLDYWTLALHMVQGLEKIE